jgi:isoleucyl-tRNA synthetase
MEARAAGHRRSLAGRALLRYGVEMSSVAWSREGRRRPGRLQALLRHPFCRARSRCCWANTSPPMPVPARAHRARAWPGGLRGQPAYGLMDTHPAAESIRSVAMARICRHARGRRTAFIWKANDSITELLRERGVLLRVLEAYPHSYPHCWRHKTPVAFRATPQWFISMTQAGLRDCAPRGHSEGALGARNGAGTHPRHGRQAARLVHLAAAHMGRAHCLFVHKITN